MHRKTPYTPLDWFLAIPGILPVAIAVTRAADGILLYGNQQLGALFGTPVEELLGRGIDAYYAEDAVRESLRAAVARDGAVREVDIRMRRTDGTVVPVLASLCRALYADDTDVVLASFTDLSERRRMEQALTEMAKFPEMNPGPVCRIENDGTVILANAPALKLFGDRELLGRSWLEVCPGMTEEMWARIRRGGRAFQHEVQFGPVSMMLSHVLADSGDFVLVFGTDLTRQKTAERLSRQSEKMATLGTLAAGVAHELNNPAAAAKRAAAQLREAFARLEEAHRLLDATGVSSAMGGTLEALDRQARERSISISELGAVERSDLEARVETWLEDHAVEDPWDLSPQLVGMGLDPEALQKTAATLPANALHAVLVWAARVYPVYSLLNEIAQGSGRISEIVGALKGYSYLGQAPVQAVNLHEGLDNTLVILRSKLKVGITVHREYGADVPPVQAYGSELNQVWTNILDNAADAMGGKGEITIRTRRENRWAVIELEDNGPGIPADIQSRIFDPFFTTKEPGRGTGLGLATSYSIITDKHRGRISVESRPGRTCFTVRLPIDGAPPGDRGGKATDGPTKTVSA